MDVDANSTPSAARTCRPAPACRTLRAAEITDGFADVLIGDAGLELFFAGPAITLPGKVAAETAVAVA